jgi:hypothetical protein
VDLYVHFPIHLYGPVLNYLSIGKILPLTFTTELLSFHELFIMRDQGVIVWAAKSRSSFSSINLLHTELSLMVYGLPNTKHQHVEPLSFSDTFSFPALITSFLNYLEPIHRGTRGTQDG